MKALQQLGDWRLVHRIRETRSGVHWQTANGFLLVELPSESVEAPATAGAFSRCIEAFAGIFRPDIARVVDWTSGGECRCVVLEVPAGATLRELEDRIFLPPDVRARVILDVLEAIEAAHASSAVFGDLDADGVIVSEAGQVVLLPTCSRAKAASPADDIAAVAKLAGIPHFQQTTHTLGNRLRALGAVANRETVARFVSRMVLASNRPQRTTSQPAPRAFSRSFSDDDLTPVRPVDLDRMRARAISELFPDDLIPLGGSEPEIVVHIEQPPILRNTERPVVSEAEVVDFRARPTARSRMRHPLLRMAALLAACAAVGVTGAVWWRTPPAWLAPAVLALQRTLQPAAPAVPVAQRATAAQPATVAAASQPEVTAVSPPDVGAATPATMPTPPRPAETAQADDAPPSRTLAPAKRTAPRWRAPRTGTRRRTARDTKARESSGYTFMPKQL